MAIHRQHRQSAPLTLSDGWQAVSLPAGLAPTPAELTPDLPWRAARIPEAATTAGDPHALDHWWRIDHVFPPGARLVFGGLATLAEIWLDGRLAARSENMFRSLDLTIPATGASRLEICCRALRPRLAGRGPGRAPRWRNRLTESEGLRRLRTTLLGHMPGWAPPPVIGPWRPVQLHHDASDAPRCRATRLCAKLVPDGGLIELRLEGAGLGGRRGTLSAAGRSVPLKAEGDDALAASLLVPDPPLWWPHTHGAAALFEATADLDGHLLPLGRVGFRRIERAPGEGFALRVNGEAVFCRGALWTGPLQPAAMRATLERAREAGLNMIRVPGFALYPDPGFHALCDELGLLVWLDFMFARFDYPADDAFLAEAAEEARMALEAIGSSPSLAVLCGGSEVAQAAAMAGRPPTEWTAPLFETVLAGEAAALRPDTIYLPHAPLGAPGGLPFAAAAPVAHYFGLGGYLRPPEDLLSAGVRFAAACLAFANPPDPAGCRAFGAAPGGARWRAAVPRDLGAAWDFEEARDHYLGTLFGLSPTSLRRTDPEAWLAHGRAALAWIFEEAFAAWRSDGRCAGALVMLLQDLAPGPGWGVIGHDGRPKSPWHALRRACQPVQLLLRDHGQNGIALHLLNETAMPRPVRVALRGLALDGGVEDLGSLDLDLPARGALRIPAEALLGRWRDLGQAWGFGPPAFVALGATLDATESGARLAEATRFPAGLALPRSRAGLSAELRETPEGWRLRLAARGFAQFVTVDDDGFWPEEDHFHLWPGETREVALRPVSGTRPAGSVAALNALDAAHYRAAA